MDVTVPLVDNLTKRENEKIERYLPLADEIKGTWYQNEVKVILIGAMEKIPVNLKNYLTKLDIIM